MIADGASEKPAGAENGSRLSVCVLGSGSKGNAIYISDGSSAVLLDAGFSGVEIQRRMAARGLDPETLDAILVTHEHSDHIQGVGVLSRRYRIPVYISRETEKASLRQLGTLKDRRHFQCGQPFTVGRLTIHPFPISHDAGDPAGFTVGGNGLKIGIATDLGVATQLVKTHLSRCALLVLEANHDPEMLANGPYPWPLKQRVSGRTGHLSNDASRNLLEAVQHDDLAHVVLAHLSEINNTPNRAYQTVARALTRCTPRLTVADQHRAGEIIRL